jgi:L-histidine N-alpha-methyltransferase
VAVDPVVGEFEDAWALPTGDAPLVAFLGGTLGNFLPAARAEFLEGLAAHLGPDGHALIGIDLVKDRDELVAAYDDAAGVTAAFNRNVLAVLNRRLGADFDVDNFEHVALYDERHDWIEMRLRAIEPCVVDVADLGLRVEFAAGEELRTEISAKFTRERFVAELHAAGLACCEWFSDPRERFALVLCRARSAP